MAARRAARAGGTRGERAETAPSPRLVTQAEYARHRGVSRQRVGQWLARGWLVTRGDGRDLRVDVDASDERVARYRDPQQDAARAARGLHTGRVDASDGETFEEGRRRKALAEARIAELKAAELEGRLIDKEATASAVYTLAAEQREALLNLPARMAADGAARLGCAEPALYRWLDEVLREHLRELGSARLRLPTTRVAFGFDDEEENETENEDEDDDA